MLQKLSNPPSFVNPTTNQNADLEIAEQASKQPVQRTKKKKKESKWRSKQLKLRLFNAQ
jgi:hypothetical protein